MHQRESMEPQLPLKNSFSIYCVEGDFEQLGKAGEGGEMQLFGFYRVSAVFLPPFPCKHTLSVGCWVGPTAPEKPVLSGNVHVDTSSVEEKTQSGSSG